MGEAWVRLPQLLLVFFLLGSCPMQTKQGGKVTGTGRRGKCWTRWLDPRNLWAPPGWGLQLEPCSLLVTLCGQNPKLADDPRPGLLGMEKHFPQP